MAFFIHENKIRTSSTNWRSKYAPGTVTTPAARTQTFRSDNIRPTAVYVESDHDIAPGHVVEWTGTPTNFLTNGTRSTVYSSENGHEYALSSVRPTGNHSTVVAGVVIDKAAEPGAESYTHKGGVQTTHSLPEDAKHIYRVGRDIALAWVLDAHHGELEGLYTRYVNGVEDSTGPYQLRMSGRDRFTIERTTTATAELQLADLTARFDALVSQ